jgi:hypothetical protein
MNGREQELISRIKPIYISILKALRLINANDGQSRPTSAVSSVIKLFQTYLENLYQTALDEVTRKEQIQLNRNTIKKPKSNSRAVKATGPEDEHKCHGRLGALTKLMTSLLAVLDTAMEADNELYEATSTICLDHVGSEVSLLIFADPQNKEAGILPVTGLVDSAHIDSESAISTAKMTGPHLVRILQAVARAAPSNSKITSSTQPNSRQGPVQSPDTNGLLGRVQGRLQHTLLRGIFGDEDGSFKDAFSRRDAMDEHEQDHELEDQEADEALSNDLVAQVWELIGWDVLSDKAPVRQSRRP